MQIPHAPKSSFGLPKEMQEQLEKSRQPKKEPPTENAIQEDWPLAPEVEVKEQEADKTTTEEAEEAVQRVDPYAILKQMGIEPKEEDFHSLMFRGFVEKIVTIAKNPVNGQALTAKIKTLTAEELDLVDEMVAESLEKTKMTNTGLETRRTMWVMSMAIMELNGRQLAKPVLGEDKLVDVKATAAAKRAVISKLSPYIIDTVVRIHAQMSSCYNFIVTDQESKVIKKS